SCGVTLSELSRLVTEQIFLAALHHHPLHQTLCGLGIGSAGAIRDHFRKEGLPSPRKWRRLAEAFYAVLRLRRDAGSLLSHALELGYSDASALSHQLAGVFGAAPSVIRATIGWEWWAHAWLQRRKARGEFAD